MSSNSKVQLDTNCQAPETDVTARTTSILSVFKNKRVLNVISIIGFLGIWDIIVILGLAPLMPRPIEVVQSLINMLMEPLAGRTMLGHVWISFRRIIIAFLIAAGVGIPIGVLMGFNKYAYGIIKPIFEFFKPMPPIAWISLSILWFGIGETSKIFIILIGAVVPVIINSFNGIRLVEPELYDCIRNLGASYWQEHFQVTFPASYPAIFAGLQVALSISWTCVVAAELVGAREGVGFIIVQGMNIDNTAMVIAGMLVICLVAFLSSLAIVYLERGLCPWKRTLD
ncbi:MAG: ABC transporter permease [Dehalobacterium sp.]|jgi:sulfonate transport system permease protein